jgi:hypothetical protein
VAVADHLAADALFLAHSKALITGFAAGLSLRPAHRFGTLIDFGSHIRSQFIVDDVPAASPTVAMIQKESEETISVSFIDLVTRASFSLTRGVKMPSVPRSR